MIGHLGTSLILLLNVVAVGSALFIPPTLVWSENAPQNVLMRVLSPVRDIFALDNDYNDKSPEQLRVFITGATGYIGGEFLHKLLSDDKHDFNIRALVRSKEKGQLLLDGTDYGIKPVVGDLDSTEILESEFEAADIIINAATNDHLSSTKVLDEVLSKKDSTTILFHIAGVSVLATTNQTDKTVWSDIDDNKKINELPDDRPHIEIDRTIMNIKNKNPKYARPVIISPATIYGTGQGYDNVLSVQVPTLVRKSIELGQSFTVKSGEYDWSNIHIRDLGSMFIFLLDKLIEDKNSIKTGNEGYYFAEAATHSWLDVSERIAELLHERQVVNTTDVVHLEEKDADVLFGRPLSALYDTNALTKADLARSYGWAPSHDLEFEQSIEVSVSDELD